MSWEKSVISQAVFFFKRGEELVQMERKIITFLLSIPDIKFILKKFQILFSCGTNANPFHMTKEMLFFLFDFIRYNSVSCDDS